jgi:hypothetical protein
LLASASAWLLEILPQPMMPNLNFGLAKIEGRDAHNAPK